MLRISLDLFFHKEFILNAMKVDSALENGGGNHTSPYPFPRERKGEVCQIFIQKLQHI